MTSSSTLPRLQSRGGKPTTRPLRVLYADDMLELRELMGHVLGREGHTLETCSNGEMALAQLQLAPNHYDLLITDHHMPVMNGLELVRKVRQLPFTGRIIVFSSELCPSVYDEYLSQRVDRVIAKPVLPGELRQLLAEMFPAV
jgi:CheY-like chemotaxis protein